MNRPVNFLKAFLTCITAMVLCVMLVSGTMALADPRVLGVSAPLSGGGAGWGNDFKNVMTFANEKLAPGQYKLVFEDDRCENKSDSPAIDAGDIACAAQRDFLFLLRSDGQPDLGAFEKF